MSAVTFTKKPVVREGVTGRLRKHITGRGGKLPGAAAAAGITITVARIWTNVDRAFERSLKRRHNAKRLCPICKGEVDRNG